METKISRRGLLKGGAIALGYAATVGTLTSCGLGGDSSKKLFVRSSAGARDDVFRKYIWPNFTKKTGVEIVPVTANAAKMVTMMKSGRGGLDIIDTGSFGVNNLVKTGGLLELDMDRFKTFTLSDIEQSDPHWLSQEIYSEALIYNSKKIKGPPPENWADFWNVSQFPGRRVLEDASAEHPPLEQALLADGVPMESLYPLDVDRAFRKLDEIKPRILKFWTQGAESESLFSTGQAVMGEGWTTRMESLADSGVPLKIVWDGAGSAAQCLGIAKNSTKHDLAYTYIDYLLSPKVNATFCSHFPGGPGNKKTLDLIKDPATLNQFANSKQHEGKVFTLNVTWWDANMRQVLERWSRFVSS